MKELGFVFVFKYNGNKEAPQTLQEAMARMGPIVTDSQDGEEWDDLAEIAGVGSVTEIAPYVMSEGIPYFSEGDRQKVLEEVRKCNPTATFA